MNFLKSKNANLRDKDFWAVTKEIKFLGIPIIKVKESLHTKKCLLFGLIPLKIYKIINPDALTYCGNIENLKDIKDNPNYKFVHGNICDNKLVRELVEQSDCVINFAAESHVDNSIKHPEIFIETNVQGTLNLLQASKELGVEKYLQVSTDEVYGTLGKSGYFYETTPLAPNSPYSASKASADMLVRVQIITVLISILKNLYRSSSQDF